ncbi:MAG: tetratricopeptide repeat protein [Moraxellaceae bacterium]
MPHSDVIALLQEGNAVAARQRLLTEPQTNAEQDFLLGVCAHLLNEIPQALQYFTAALKRDAAHARAASALSSIYSGLGHPAQAEQLLRHTLAHINDVQLHFNLGVALEQQEKFAEALTCYSQLLQQHPSHYGARHNRGGLYARQMRLHDAASDYRELTRLHPAITLPWQNLADIDISLGRYDEALTLLQEVRRREPANSKALQSMAVAHAALGQFPESDAAFRELKVLDAERWESARLRIDASNQHSEHIDSRIIYLVREYEHMEVCQWSSWPRSTDAWHDFIRKPGPGDLLALSFRSLVMPLSNTEQREISRYIDRQARGQFLPRTWPATPTPARLRIGYISAWFGRHATGVLVRRFFAAHGADIEVILVALSPSDGSDVAREIYTSATSVLDVSSMDDATARAAIAALNLDVLVDFNGYTSGSRAGLMIDRLAPVQLHWLIMTASTGSPSIDYYISDAEVRPHDDWCDEAEVLMPECYFVFSTIGDTPPLPPPRQQLGLPENRFVFCCLNASQKIDPDTFTLWMDLLRDAPESVLWLLGSSTATIMNLKREAEWRGIDPRRLLFAPKIDHADHVARMGAADLFLDTRYYNAHTTAAEALWAGLPVLTCPGETYPSRVGKSLVLSCELPELIAKDWNEYREIALRAARDKQWLSALRTRLAESRLRSAVFDVKKQARNVEKAYRHMRERFAQGLPPVPFNIADLPD